MKKYVIAGVLIAAFVTPALAEEIYVVFDPASHKCEAMHNIPEGKNSMGKFGSMEEAKKAMASMKECGDSSPLGIRVSREGWPWCHPFLFYLWHFSDVPRALTNVCCWSRADITRTGRFANDPNRTFAILDRIRRRRAA